MNRATRITVMTVGILGGLISMEHGLFEMLQGNTPTNGIDIMAMGPEQRLWEGAGERTLTLIPNFLVTGIIAVFLGMITILWSVRFAHKKGGGWGLLLLSIATLLFGGGIAFFILGLINSLAATRINKPLKLWRRLLPASVRLILSKVWGFVLISAIVTLCASVLMAVFGLPNLETQTTTNIIYAIAYSHLGLMAVSYVAGFGADIKHNDENLQTENN